jgi:hypothetical protein
MDNVIEYSCPYCGEINCAEVFISEGRNQNFVNDCEVCCRPIELKVNFDREGNPDIEIKNDDGY